MTFRARALAGWTAALLGAALLAAAETLLIYRAGPAVAVALPFAAGVAAVIVWRPVYGVYVGILAVPLELLNLRVGGQAGLSPTEGVLLLTAAVAAARLITGEVKAPHSAHLWFAGFLGVVLLGLFFAEDTFIVAKITVMWTAFLLVSMLVANATRTELHGVLACLAVTGGVVGLIAITGTSDQELVGGGTIATNRAEGTFAHPNVLAFVMIMTIPVALVLALEARTALVRVGYLIAAGLGVAGLMLSLSRGGLVGGAVALIVLLAWPRFRRYAFALLTVFAVFAAFNLGSIQGSSELGLVGQRVGTLSSAAGDRSDPRFKIWRETPAIVRDRPLLGVGEGNYPVASPRYGIRDVGGHLYDHAHNLALTIAAETGLLGLLLFSAFVIAAGRAGASALRGRRADVYPEALAIVAALTGLLVTSIGEYAPRTNVIMALILIEVGALVGYSRFARQQVRARNVL